MNTIFKALNDPTRRDILNLLKSGEQSAGSIAEVFDISKPSISHHLDILRQSGLVSSRREGQFIMYALNTSILEDVLQWLITLKK